MRAMLIGIKRATGIRNVSIVVLQQKSHLVCKLCQMCNCCSLNLYLCP